jgi:hypothetical protein
MSDQDQTDIVPADVELVDDELVSVVGPAEPASVPPIMVPIRFPASMLRELDAAARARFISRAAIVRSACARYLRELRQDGEL